MSTKELIVHWRYIPPEEVGSYPVLWRPKILVINEIILRSEHLIMVNGSTRLPYSTEFDVAIVSGSALQAVEFLVNLGEQVDICGTRKSVCCASAEDRIAHKIGQANVWINPHASWD